MQHLSLSLSLSLSLTHSLSLLQYTNLEKLVE